MICMLLYDMASSVGKKAMNKRMNVIGYRV